MLLFQRRRSKDAEAEPATAAPAAEPSAPVPPPRGAAPPPLPQRAPGSGLSPAPERFSRCFVCGSPLEAGSCPKCRMAWVD